MKALKEGVVVREDQAWCVTSIVTLKYNIHSIKDKISYQYKSTYNIDYNLIKINIIILTEI
jgi:hypothetical protein